MKRILLGLTGSVATVLYEKLIAGLGTIGPVDVILTERAKHFVDMKLLCDALEKVDGFLYTEEDEWTWKTDYSISTKWHKNDPVLHIQLRESHSALVIAPCSANTMGKMANGLCDNLLTSVARAWDVNRPVIIAPAMNTNMWEHPMTKIHIKTLKDFGYRVVPPVSKMLACGTEGMGALASIEDIVETAKKALQWRFPLETQYLDGLPIYTTYGIPVEGHPGAFEAKRKNSTHTGVDLYADEETLVYPVETGKVVAVAPFTGPKDNSPWWLDTDCVLVEGASGVVCYGEIEPYVSVGDKVVRGNTAIGRVKRVIPPDRPQHPELSGWKPSMLHIELYPHGCYKPSDGYGKSFNYLQDPTPYLLDAEGAPSNRYKKV